MSIFVVKRRHNVSSTQTCPTTLQQKFQNSLYICASATSAKGLVVVHMFQQLTTSYAWLLGLHRCYLLCNLLRPGVGGRGGPSLDCVMEAGALPTCSLQFSDVSNLQCEVMDCHCSLVERKLWYDHRHKKWRMSYFFLENPKAPTLSESPVYKLFITKQD